MSDSKYARSASWPLEPDEATFRAWLDHAADLMVEHLRTLPEQSAGRGDIDMEQVAALVEPMPEQGRALAPLLDRVVRDLVPQSFNAAGPGYLAYIPGGGIVTAAIADLVTNITNRYIGMFAAAPLLARLELNVIRWFADLMGFPEKARGILTSGGSMANMIALVCARHRLLGERFSGGVIYVSDQVHHSVTKAARFVGFTREQVRAIATGDDFRLDPERLTTAIAEDRERGLQPAIIVASGGTTNTGAVDDLDGLADVAAEHRLWLHIDAAYGGFFQLTERGRARLSGIERAHSITIDPHKSLFLPYGTGCLLVRDGKDLYDPHHSITDYLPPLHDSGLAQDFAEYSPELSRDFRGLRVWLTIQTFGAAAFRDCLDEKLDLAEHCARRLVAMPGIRLVAEPDLSLVRLSLGRRSPAGRQSPDRQRAGPGHRQGQPGPARPHSLSRQSVDERLVGQGSFYPAHLHHELPHPSGSHRRGSGHHRQRGCGHPSGIGRRLRTGGLRTVIKTRAVEHALACRNLIGRVRDGL